MGPLGAPGGRGYVRGKKVGVQLRTFWVVMAKIATSLYASGSSSHDLGLVHREYILMWEDVMRLDVAVRGICRGASPVGSNPEFIRGTWRLSCWVPGG